MDPTANPVSPARAVRILHGALVGGLVVAGATFTILLRVQGPFGAPSTVGLILTGIAVGSLALAVMVFRRKVPERAPGQSPDAYWSAAETRGAAIVLWAVIESAGLLSLIGWLQTGELAPVAVAALAAGLLILVRPARLEGDYSV